MSKGKASISLFTFEPCGLLSHMVIIFSCFFFDLEQTSLFRSFREAFTQPLNAIDPNRLPFFGPLHGRKRYASKICELLLCPSAAESLSSKQSIAHSCMPSYVNQSAFSSLDQFSEGWRDTFPRSQHRQTILDLIGTPRAFCLSGDEQYVIDSSWLVWRLEVSGDNHRVILMCFSMFRLRSI